MDFGQTVHQAVKLSGIFTDIGSQSGSGEIQRVDEAQTGGSGGPSRGQRAEQVLELLGLGVVRAEVHSEGVFEGEVQGLGGEISNDVRQVASVKSADALFFDHSAEAVSDSGVSRYLSGLDLGVSILGLEKQLHSFDGGHCGFGNCRRDTAGHEIYEKGLLSFFRGFGHLGKYLYKGFAELLILRN